MNMKDGKCCINWNERCIICFHFIEYVEGPYLFKSYIKCIPQNFCRFLIISTDTEQTFIQYLNHSVRVTTDKLNVSRL